MPRATVEILTVVIASPGDVAEERDLVEVVVRELNDNSARDRGVRLEVARWETDSYPGFHAEGPQGIVDDALEIEGAWVLVGILWTHFGTPTADGKTGTEHEIDKAIAAWKENRSPQPMIYFRTECPKLRGAAARRQWAQVGEYQEKIAEEQGLYWEYETPADFERELRRTLQNYLRQKYPIPARTEPTPKTTTSIPTGFLQTYRTRMMHRFETWDTTNLGVRLAGADKPKTVYLDRIYLTLRLAEGYDINELEKGEALAAENLLARDRPLLIRGPAGAGKTT